jgi:hypothetical protein
MSSRSDPAQGGRHRLRTPLAVILLVLACILGLVTSIGFWTHSLIMNTDNFVGMVGPVLKDKTVTKTVGTYVADKVIDVANVEDLIRSALPERIDFLASPLTSELRDQVRTQMTKALRSKTVYDLWIKINRFTHEQAIAMLRGQTTTMRIEDDKIVLDTVPLIAIGLKELDKLIPGMIGERVSLPQIDVNASPEVQRGQLSEALGIEIKPTFGKIVLVQSAEVRTAQKAVKAFDIVIWLLLGATIVFTGAAVAVSARRRRTLIQLGLGAAVVVVLVFVVMGQLKGWLIGSIKVKGLMPVVDESVTRVLDSLKGTLAWMLWAGAAIAVVAYLAGLPRWLVRTAGWVNQRAHAGAGGVQRVRGPVETWVAAHATGLEAGGLVVAIVLLFFASSSLGWSIAVIALLAVYEIAVVALAGRRPDWLPGGRSRTENGLSPVAPGGPRVAAAVAGAAGEGSGTTVVPALAPADPPATDAPAAAETKPARRAGSSAGKRKPAAKKPAAKKPAAKEPGARKPAARKKAADPSVEGFPTPEDEAGPD